MNGQINLNDLLYSCKRNKYIYAILAIGFGTIGAQHFYVGRNMLGMLSLLFCWTFIPTTVGIFQGVAALLKPSDGHGNIYFI